MRSSSSRTALRSEGLKDSNGIAVTSPKRPETRTTQASGAVTDSNTLRPSGPACHNTTCIADPPPQGRISPGAQTMKRHQILVVVPAALFILSGGAANAGDTINEAGAAAL